ncbi:MAG: hypothetical protein ABIY37_09290 [Devosia sp.]
MPQITDELMESRLETVRPYATVFLKKGTAYTPPDDRSAADATIVREHGRRNFKRRASWPSSVR